MDAQLTAVVGGGWAGLAAAVTLAAAGRRVVVFEAAHTPGGRARRIDYRGQALDNGLHILIGAYRETLALIDLVTSHAPALRDEPLDLHFPGRFRLRAPALPAPWHLAAALLCCRGLSWAERIAAARFMSRLRRMRHRLPQDISVERLLADFGQSVHACTYLWHPLCIAALNTQPAQASAQVFLNVLRDSFDGSRRDSRLLLPTADLGELFPAPAVRWLVARGSEVRLGHPVERIETADGKYRIISAGGAGHFEQVVCALPPYRVKDVAGSVLPAPLVEQIDGLRHEPIYSIYIQYPDGARLPQPMLGMAGGLTHWVFDRGRLCGQDGLIAAVISAHGAHEALSHDELAASVERELRTAFPALGTPRWHKVVAEKRATFACTPGLSRPDQLTGMAGLYLAGDYTASPYPGTLEAAVRSGVRCAQALLESRR